MADRLELLRFQLQSLPTAPEIPRVTSVSARINDLIDITKTVSDRIRHCMSDLGIDPSVKAALTAYSSALAPLGEALTELGRMHAEVAYYNFVTHPRHRDNQSDLGRHRQQVTETVSGCFEAADEILEVTAIGLRDTAKTLAPSPSYLRPAAPARALPAANPRSAALPPVPPSTAPGAAKSR
ncbi:hypothetical protein ACFVP0_10110 [Streptomyces cinereoruber]|uniref:hypothetical protein n=1 Tax=Streptomyces cinereoruber TaxID=67260 RepID=UPI0036ACBC2C